MRHLSALFSLALYVELLYASHLPPISGAPMGDTVQPLSDVRAPPSPSFAELRRYQHASDTNMASSPRQGIEREKLQGEHVTVFFRPQGHVLDNGINS